VIKSSSHNKPTPNFLQARSLPVAQPTVSKYTLIIYLLQKNYLQGMQLHETLKHKDSRTAGITSETDKIHPRNHRKSCHFLQTVSNGQRDRHKHTDRAIINNNLNDDNKLAHSNFTTNSDLYYYIICLDPQPVIKYSFLQISVFCLKSI